MGITSLAKREKWDEGNIIHGIDLEFEIPNLEFEIPNLEFWIPYLEFGIWNDIWMKLITKLKLKFGYSEKVTKFEKISHIKFDATQ